MGPRGTRWIKAEDFFLGRHDTAWSPDEILEDQADRHRQAYAAIDNLRKQWTGKIASTNV